MIQKLIYIIIGITYLYSSWPILLQTKAQEPVLTSKIASIKDEVFKPIITKKVTLDNVALKTVTFTQLPGWQGADVKKSLLAFQKSCETFLKRGPTQRVGSRHISLRAKDWHPACTAALSIDPDYEAAARIFFEKWFYPIEFAKRKPINGLFTGYYMPQLKGSLTQTKEYNTPIYGMPEQLHWSARTKKQNNSRRNYTREEIDKGALKKQAPVIAWINSPVDRLFLEIEGAGIIKLPNGKNLYLGYAGENGAPYTSIGNILIKQHVFTKDSASKKAIVRYLENNPKKANSLLQKNQSFVFFQSVDREASLGAQGVALTPGYSLAIDRKWIPIGAPLWLATKVPNEKNQTKKFQRLMIAQDTGGAIQGVMRGDIYWGSGKRATYLGEHMKNEGHYWLLLPKRVFDRIAT
ncbi:MAG: MltA domain-containing protein [Legionella sp.]|nr:MltA domain-containing protein [Legionella sp.]